MMPPDGLSEAIPRATAAEQAQHSMLDTAQEFRLPDDCDALTAEQAPAQSCLVQIYPLQFSKSLIQLHPRRSLTLGRSPTCGLEVPDKLVSREHAILEWNPLEVGWQLRDCSSRNGSFVNDCQVTSRLLHPGDQIRLGGHIFKFLSSNHVETLYHETVYQMMTVDALTQVHNRRYFEDSFERELQRAQRHGRPLAVLLFDLDQFKQVNDTYGHLVGDEVLQCVCQRVRRRVRRDELFARYGGEEFAVVLAESAVSHVLQVAEEMRKIIGDQPIRTSRGPLSVTISIGVAHTSGLEPLTSAELLARADERLYEAKHAGRNCVRS